MKKALALLLALTMVFALVACGKTEAPAEKPADAPADAPAEAPVDDKVYELSLGHIQNPGHNEANAYDAFAELLAEKSGGRIKLTVYPSCQLGTDREMIEQCAQGTLDICASDGGGFATSLGIPELGVFNMPFLYDNLEAQERLINEIMVSESANMMADSPVMPIMCYTNGIRHALLINNPIETLEDIKGLKFRVPEIAIYVDTWTALGANATTTPWSEVYTALSQGVVEACEADAVGFVNTNLQEVTNYMSETGHMGGYHISVINRDSFNKLPADLQEIFLECCKENQAAQIASRAADDAVAYEALEAAGVKINSVSYEERMRMVNACADIYQEYRDMGLGDLIDRMLELSK